MHIVFLPIGPPRGIPLSQVMFLWMETTHGIVEIGVSGEEPGRVKRLVREAKIKSCCQLSPERQHNPDCDMGTLTPKESKKPRTAGAGQRRGSLVTCLYLVPG